MHFGKNFILFLCLTMSTSEKLGDECYVEVSLSTGICQNFLECDFYLATRYIPGYCDEAKSIVCCPPLTFEDGKCFHGLSGVYGKCQNLLECNYYALNYHKKPQYCTDGTVCCPPVQLRLSDKMCLEYHTEKDKGVGGVQADNVTARKKAFRKPSHMAAIGFGDHKNVIMWFCGGSIISPFFILSFAHCIQDGYNFLDEPKWAKKWVKISDLHKLYFVTEVVSPQHFRVIDTFIHPDYDYKFIYHDIALLKLEKAIVFGDDYQPACLHTHTKVPEIMQETIWELNSKIPYRQIKLKVVEYKACTILHQDDNDEEGLWHRGIIDEIQICAWDVSGNIICPYDYTNVLQYKVEGLGNVREHHVVAGVGAYGPCAPIIFTRVSAYLDWIEEIVWEDEIESETVTFVFTN